MGQPVPHVGHFLSRFLLAVIPGVVASVVGAYVLHAIHLDRAMPTDQQSLAAPLNDDLTAEERRELTRQMLKARRENPEVPVQVRPTPGLRSSTTGTADNAADAKARTEQGRAAAPSTTASIPPVPPARPTALASRSRPDTPPVTTPATVAPALAAPLGAAMPVAAPVVAAPPVGGTSVIAATAVPPTAASPATALPTVVVAAPSVPAPSVAGAPSQLAPAVANANAPPAAAIDPDTRAAGPQRSFAANVFSSISVLAGTAANATGNTVNWVFELPGKAISVGGNIGGKILGGGGDPDPSQPAAAPASPPEPAPKRNAL